MGKEGTSDEQQQQQPHHREEDGSSAPSSSSPSSSFLDFEDFQSFQQALFETLVPAVHASVTIPKDEEHKYYLTFPEFKCKAKAVQNQLLDSIAALGKLEHGNLKDWSREDMEAQMHFISGTNDIALDRVSTFLDDTRGANKRSGALEKSLGKHAVHTVSLTSGAGAAPGRKRGGLQATNIARPQVFFPDRVDNTPGTFRPKLTSKPNAKVPLNLTPQRTVAETELGDEEQIVYFEHPYEKELQTFEVPDFALERPQNPDEHRRRRSMEECEQSPAVLVDTTSKLEELMAALEGVKEIAVDLEAHNVRSYLGFSCLMQISTRDRDFLVDTLALRSHLECLNKYFTDPNVVKVLHGADSDILWLQRDHGLYMVNMFDTGQAMRVLGYPKYSLAYLLKHLFSLVLDKRHQLSDWRIRPLPADMRLYAQADTHFLLDAYDALKVELLDRGNENANLLRSVFTRSTDLCLQRFEVPRYSEEQALALYNKQALGLSPKALAVFKALHAWRDGIARDEDESPRYVMEDHMLFELARHAPDQPSQVFALCQPTPTLVRMHAHAIIETVQNAQLGLTDIDRLRAEATGGDVVITREAGGALAPGAPGVLSREAPRPSQIKYDVGLPSIEDLNLSKSHLVKSDSTPFASALKAKTPARHAGVVDGIFHSFATTPLFAATPKEVVDMLPKEKEDAGEEEEEAGAVSDSQPDTAQQQQSKEDTVVIDSDADDDVVVLSETKHGRGQEAEKAEFLADLEKHRSEEKKEKAKKRKKKQKEKRKKKAKGQEPPAEQGEQKPSKRSKKKLRKMPKGQWRKDTGTDSTAAQPAKRPKFDPFTASDGKESKKKLRTKKRASSRSGSMKLPK